MSEPVRPVDVIRVGAEQPVATSDFAAAEEPLQVRVNGQPFAIIMRTPGLDEELAAGFLFSEGVVTHPAQLRRLRPQPSPVPNGGVLEAELEVVVPLELHRRRNVRTNSSCGACGRLSLEGLRVNAEPLEAGWAVPAGLVCELGRRLRSAQSAFDQTGGLHAAGLFSLAGQLQMIAEDVGRHNAVDKVIGRMLLDDRLPLTRSLLFVSGRTSYEIVQKAALARIPLVAAVSAPSTYAVDLATACGVTLLGFVREGRFNIYSHQHRIETGLTRLETAGPQWC